MLIDARCSVFCLFRVGEKTFATVYSHSDSNEFKELFKMTLYVTCQPSGRKILLLLSRHSSAGDGMFGNSQWKSRISPEFTFIKKFITKLIRKNNRLKLLYIKINDFRWSDMSVRRAVRSWLYSRTWFRCPCRVAFARIHCFCKFDITHDIMFLWSTRILFFVSISIDFVQCVCFL